MATGTFSRGSILTGSIARGTWCGRRRSTGSLGGRDGFRSTGDSSIRRRCIGTRNAGGRGEPSGAASASDALGTVDETAASKEPGRIVTYREFVTHRTSPRDWRAEIIQRSVLSGCEEQIASDAYRAPKASGQT